MRDIARRLWGVWSKKLPHLFWKWAIHPFLQESNAYYKYNLCN